jgi:hypothetical protein
MRERSTDGADSSGKILGNMLLSEDIECPICEEIAHSFRILAGTPLRPLAAEFYHGEAVCAGAIQPDTPVALTLQRLGLPGIAPGPRLSSKRRALIL